jgi:phosphatidylinositol glycan class P protein
MNYKRIDVFRFYMKSTQSKADPKKKTEHSPAPQPERAVYGFLLLVSSLSAFIIYVLVSYLPDWIFVDLIGWDYLPDKYWSIALPAYLIVITLMILPLYLSINMTKVNDLSSINSITDEFSLSKESQVQLTKTGLEPNSIDPVYDIPIGDICHFLYYRANE